MIVRDVAYGVRRFSEIQQDLGISANVLADRLESLVSDGVLETSVYQDRPVRREYRLTEKGADLIPALIALMEWGDRWSWPEGRGPVQVLHDACGEPVSVEVRCEHCQQEVASAELRARPSGRVSRLPADGEPGFLSARALAASTAGVRLDV